MATRGRRPATAAGVLLIVIGAFHLTLFVVQAGRLGYLGRWAGGDLLSLSTVDARLSQSEAAFWLSLGSFAVPMILVGMLIIRFARAGLAVPAGVVWGLAIWISVCTLTLEPSGFPVALVPVVLLCIARRSSTKTG